MRNKYIVPVPSLTCSFKKSLLLSLVPFTNARWEPEKKNFRLTPQNLASVGLRFCFFGQFSTEGTEVKSASVTQTEVELSESTIVSDN